VDTYGRNQVLRGNPWIVANLDTFAGRGDNHSAVGLGLSDDAIKQSELGPVFESLLSRPEQSQLLVSTVGWSERWTHVQEAFASRKARSKNAEGEGERTARQAETAQTEDVLSRVESAFEVALGTSPVGPDDDFVRLGGDSLAFLDLVDALQKELGIDIPIQEAYAAQTPRLLGSLCESILRSREAQGETGIESDVAAVRSEP
jgi:acyl carrier protein